MQFKRLNNMTGMDSNLNRRITSIYINEFEALRNAISGLIEAAHADQVIEALHKLKPGMVIFEHEGLIPGFEKLIERKQKSDFNTPSDIEVNELLATTDSIISHLKSYLKTIV
jgi:hypothetical protein